MKNLFWPFLMLFFVFLIHIPAQAQTKRYVKQSGSGTIDGTSWANASNSLQAMIDSSLSGDSIFVAAGTYQPLSGESFHMKEGVKIYGHFNGTETYLSQRMLNNIDTSFLKGNGSNVIYNDDTGLTNAAILDGFTIKGGAAPYAGGGVYNFNCDASFSNCIFTSNNADVYGGGVAIERCNPVFSNCVFIVNTKSGMSICCSAYPVLNNCLFINNTSNRGGGIQITEYSAPTINNSVFIGNSATNGGAIENSNSSNAAFNNCLFIDNSATNGGAMNNYMSSSPVFTNCLFTDNSAATGGVMYNNSDCNPDFRNTIIWSNSSIAYNRFSNPIYSFCNVQGAPPFGTRNISADPLFVNDALPLGADNLWGTADDGFRLSCYSPCLDTGDNTLIPLEIITDITGANRIKNSIVDMGPYEGAASTGSTVASDDNIVTQTLGITGIFGGCDSLIATVQSGGNTPVYGIVTAKVWIEDLQPINYARRHYEITPAIDASIATGRVILYFAQNEFDDYNSKMPTPELLLPTSATDNDGIANIKIAKYAGISSDGSGQPWTYDDGMVTIDPIDADITWNDIQNRWEVGFDVNGFSGFFLTTSNDPLPVSWLYLSGKLSTEKCPIIQWSVNEKNVSNYQVEQSWDGKHFLPVETVSTKGDGKNEYTYTGQQKITALTFYRIRQADLDGKYSYSIILKLNNQDKIASIAIYPVPVKDNLQVTVTGETLGTNFSLYDIYGRKLQTGCINQKYFSINMSGYNAGAYILLFSNGEIFKVVKSK